MELVYFRGNNFGDKLNPFLFNALFEAVDFEERFPDHYCFGLGSILSHAYFSQIPPDGKMVVFGSGVRHQETKRPKFLQPEFVRGPISATCMDSPYIADTAYLLPFMREYPALTACAKKRRVALMPYFHHSRAVNWGRIANAAGMSLIMPSWPVAKILRAIAESDYCISGAMHGCIAADILRVPWARLRFRIHEAEPETQLVKWLDWTESIAVSGYPSFTMRTVNMPDPAANGKLEEELLHTLGGRVATESFALSRDAVFQDILARLREAVQDFSKRYGIRVNPVRTVSI